MNEFILNHIDLIFQILLSLLGVCGILAAVQIIVLAKAIYSNIKCREESRKERIKYFENFLESTLYLEVRRITSESREPTDEEIKSVESYIESISTDTGFSFWNEK